MPNPSAKDSLEIVGVLAVVASLIFVGYEIRQNTIAARAAAYQAIGIATASAFDSQAHDTDYLTLAQKPADSMTAIEWSQFAAKMTVFARLGETVLLQVEQGLLPTDAMERLGYHGWSRIFENTKEACVWHLIRPGVSTSFRNYVENGQNAKAVECSAFDIPDSL